MQHNWGRWVITVYWLNQFTQFTQFLRLAVVTGLVLVSNPVMIVQALPLISQQTEAQTRPEIEPADLLAEATRLYHQAHEQQQPSMYTQAALLGRQALVSQMQNLDENHSDITSSLAFLDELYQQMEQVPTSLPAVHQIKLRIAEGLDRQLQSVRFATDQKEQAIQLTEQLLALYQEILGHSHLITIRYQLSLARLYKYQDINEHAESLFRSALQICRDSLSLIESHSCIQESLEGLKYLYSGS
ncbi:tetratricopeptide repeat protein [Nodosilinea sp. AN01ver1]|uniref:tetratricopeptide repeat protein n=1 Tax=Nodosilinea sp. AN01ver1 TaxID=3423362 RepID=UPI003D320EA7